MRWLGYITRVYCFASLGALLPAIALAGDITGELTYVSRVEATQDAIDVVIDTRPLSDCKQASLPKARCLPAADLISPDGRLPGERDILWLLGTVGLDGSERVMVVGTEDTARDFIAGVLYLAGQQGVHILRSALTPAMTRDTPGEERSMVRTAIWTAPMRDHLWVLGRDILREKPPLLRESTSATPAVVPAHAVVVAARADTAIARFTALRADQQFDVRVYPGGTGKPAQRSSL